MGNTEWTDEQGAWIKTRRKRHLRILAAVLSLCVLFATYPNILETFFVFAAEREKEEKDLYISGFSDLPEEIKEQTVPLGTGLEELTLPDTLEAVVVQDGQGSAENSDEDADDREIGDADEETDAKTPSDKDEIGEDTGEPSDGEETGEETTEPSDGEETGGETAEPSDGEETGGETAELSDGKESEADNSGSTEENENVDQVEQDTQPEEAAAEETIIIESGDETGGEGDSALSSESEDTELKQETHTVTLPEYQAERVITVERLENPSEKENKEDADDIEKSQAYDTDTVIITGVTWQPHPAYDKDTEGVYLFTAVLPEGYARMEGIGLPRITVTVEESENVRLFLERAKILPYLESLLEDASGEEEEGYEAWEALFLESLAEAEELKELYDAFTETERAQISADIYEKLAAWWEYADFMEEAVVYAASGTDWTLDDAGLLTIKSDAGMTDWYTNGKPYHGGEVEEAVIEGGVTSVREQAFGTSCKRLARVKILSGVKNIGEGAFMNCEGLERVEIPSSVENIEKNAFYRCEKLTDVVLPSGITGIGEGAFVACKSLTNMEIPSSVTSLGDRVFANCWELTSVKIPENVTGIGVNMFLSCKKLTSIEIPAAVTSIGNTAFSGCTELTKVKMFGETPPTLGTDVFEGCGFVTAGTEGIRVPKGKASAYKITWTDWAAYITADAGWTLDNGVLTIESNDGMTDWAANGRVDENDNVKSVIIKSGVTSIIANAFSQCGNLARIEIPNTVTIIDEAALFGCINLESVEMPDGVKSIAAQAFKSSGLTSIEIPRSVTGIGDGTFQNCSKLTKVEMFSAIPPTLGVSAFEGSGFVKTNVKGKGILVPKGKAEDYKNAAGWSSYADYITDGSPFITAQPTDQMVQNGKSVTFSVTADAMDGTGTMSYQWQVDKKTGTFADVSGATSAAYTISTADKANDGYIYRCVVTNDRGTATSEAVTLTVTPSEAEKVAAAKKVVQDTLADITATNGTTKTDIQNAIDTALSNANMTDVTVTVGDLSKTEATSSAPGSISGSVSIVSKNDSDVSDSVTISKTIEKLPLSEAEKVAAAKKIVQDVLAGITATNETTKEDIQNAIDTALSNAGITDVTVTVGDLSKTEATTGATGSLSGTVSVTSQNDSSVEDSVTINKTIAKLPATEAEKVAAAKKIVQDTLAGITATNETTKADIQNAIDTALANANMADVTVTVGDLSKTEATSSAPGSVSGSVSIVSKNDSDVSDSVTISKTIEKLPLSEAEKVAAAKKIVQDVLAGITATNETTKEDIQNAIDTALSNAGITDVTVTVGDLSKTEATTGATGSLSGTVSVTSQNDSSVEDSVTINKTIVKLPATEAEKVAAAKKIVQDVLAGITATNETTKEDIQDAIDTALSDAGIEDVTVKVGDLSKTEATSDAPGNISGDVSVVSKRDSTVRDDVTINKTIPATGESHTHNYEEWRHDAKEHWKVCSCGAAGAKSKHRYDNDRDTTCNDCGYKRKVKNPDKGESDKDKPDHAGSETQNPTGNQQPTDTQPPVNPPTVAPVKTPQPVPGTADDPAKQHGAQTPKQPERKPGQDTGQEGKATVQQGGMDSAKITAEQRSEGGTAQTDSGQQSEGSAVQTDNAQQAEGGTARTVQAAADGGRIAIPGEAVETGNLTENQKTATKFELEKGAVTVSVVCDDGKCTAGVNDTAAVANTVLTPEQIQLANDGENIEVRIDVKDISQTVAEQDKEVIESGLVRYREEMPELTLGRYVDISVFVKIGEGDWDAVTSTGEPIEVVMGIPRELVENGRTFYVIRAHGGEYTLLTDMDDDPETVTIRTDLFSAYALAYRQADGTGESGRCGLCHICPTFLGICYFIWLIMIVAVVATGIILLRKKKN